jgi:alpha-beta hydrolase superfamily lysophospholipase
MYGLAKRILKVLAFWLAGVFFACIVAFVLYLQNRPDLKVWHTVELDEEFTAGAVDTFDAYLDLEGHLFDQLDTEVIDRIEPEDRLAINRYHRGSRTDPAQWARNWNRSFEFPARDPKIGVLLLHGMSDSPYSLRSIGERLREDDAWVVGLRLPGHGTTPSGLRTISWQDMAAATRLAMDHLKDRVGDRPIYIVGFSNGGALAVHYALSTLDEPDLPSADGLVLISPAIGVSPVAVLAVWQARLGNLLGMPKLEWTGISLEYDPFKYGSFAVNAGDVTYRLTIEIQARFDALGKDNRLTGMPPILAFQSIVDATVSTPALIDNLFMKLPNEGHELVLFDTDRSEGVAPFVAGKQDTVLANLMNNGDLEFTLSVIGNESPQSKDLLVRRKAPGASVTDDLPLGNSWPDDIYSLSHIALPIPPADPLYGKTSPRDSSLIYLGDLTLRGERGIFSVPAADLLRLRWNPFYAYVEGRTLEMMGIQD